LPRAPSSMAAIIVAIQNTEGNESEGDYVRLKLKISPHPSPDFASYTGGLSFLWLRPQ
jgi:hypothetical protein